MHSFSAFNDKQGFCEMPNIVYSFLGHMLPTYKGMYNLRLTIFRRGVQREP